MPRPITSCLVVILVAVSSGYAKNKTKIILPSYVLSAHTVSVVIDPDAGVSVDDPHANRIAQKDVEAALTKWGRFQPMLSTQDVDLIIVVRKGHDRLVDQTIPDPRQSGRPGVINPADDGIAVGGQRGHQPGLSDDPRSNANHDSPQTEIGAADDSFSVYQGNVEHPLDAVPAWRYIAKGGLRSHSVPAVDEFKKVLAEAEKAASKNP